MNDDPVDDAVAEECKQSPRMTATRWTHVWLIVLLAFLIGCFGGGVLNSAWVSMMGEQQGPGLDNASAIDRCAEPLDDAPLAADQQLEGAMIGPAEPPREAPEQ